MIYKAFKTLRNDDTSLLKTIKFSQITFSQVKRSISFYALILRHPLPLTTASCPSYGHPEAFVSTVSMQVKTWLSSSSSVLFFKRETNHCRKYLASLPAAESVGSEHNCKMPADAHVADSAVPIWIAPSFWDYSRKSCSNSLAVKHQNVQGVCRFLYIYSISIILIFSSKCDMLGQNKQIKCNKFVNTLFTVALRLKSSWCMFSFHFSSVRADTNC